MHRSGTSAATRSLSFLGLATCRPFDLLPALAGNERGHWESRSLTLLNESLLNEMDAAWWCPPRSDEVIRWSAQLERTTFDRLRDAHRAAHPAARPWVWKDPRLCLTLPVWKEALAGRYATVLMIRNPLEIADSLAVRNGMNRTWALALWERYLSSAVEHLEGSPVWLSRYGDLLTDPPGWCRTASQVLRSNGLEVELRPETIDHVRSFLTEDLRHHTHAPDLSSGELTERQKALWHWLDSSVGFHPRLSTTSLRSGPPEDESLELATHRRTFIEMRQNGVDHDDDEG